MDAETQSGRSDRDRRARQYGGASCRLPRFAQVCGVQYDFREFSIFAVFANWKQQFTHYSQRYASHAHSASEGLCFRELALTFVYGEEGRMRESGRTLQTQKVDSYAHRTRVHNTRVLRLAML